MSSSGEFLSFLEDDDAPLRRHCWKEVPALSPTAALSLSPRPWQRWRSRSRRELIHENGAQWGTQSGKGALCTGEHKTEAGDGTEKEERRDRHDFFLSTKNDEEKDRFFCTFDVSWSDVEWALPLPVNWVKKAIEGK